MVTKFGLYKRELPKRFCEWCCRQKTNSNNETSREQTLEHDQLF